jgi:predicted metalloprotease
MYHKKMNKEMLLMKDVIWKLLSVLILFVLLAACNDSNQITTGSEPYIPDEGGGEKPEATKVKTEDTKPEEAVTESPETFDLPKVETASPGSMLSSNLSSANVEQTMYEFLEYVLLDVDQFWSNIMIQNGFDEPYVNYAFPMTGESIYSNCGGGEYTTDDDAFYCPVDDTIVISQDVATRIWEGEYRSNEQTSVPYYAGDFSVAFVVAHEFAHSLQAELGWFPESGPIRTTRSTELNADCLSGVWAHSVYARGLLEEGDIEEAVRTLNDIANDSVNNPGTHGLPDERIEAFSIGYVDGSARSCDKYLERDY